MARFAGKLGRLRHWGKRSAPIPATDPTIADTLSRAQRHTVDLAQPFTLVSPERLVACIDAVTYVTRLGVAGAIVECGVWQGGCVLAMIDTLQSFGITDRDIYLFDTFEGMTEPTDVDTSAFDGPALKTWREAQNAGRRPWDYYFRPEAFGLEYTRSLILGTGYPPDKIHFVPGKVEDTIPEQAPPRIALLRLDTDWYGSTRHELEHLYPRLTSGGVLIVDDYGHWDGCRQAVDEYFGETPPFFARTDYTGRVAVKP